MSTQRIEMLERLVRKHKDSNPAWAKKWNAELRELRTALASASAKRMQRGWAEVQSTAHQRQLAQRRREREGPS